MVKFDEMRTKIDDEHMLEVVLVVHNVRSCHNVGSMLRTADGLGVQKVYLTGYTPYPFDTHDDRLPYISRKVDAQIHKTALGAEKTVAWQHEDDVAPAIRKLQNEGYSVIALEQAETAIMLPDFHPTHKIAVVVGREVEGIEPEVLKLCDQIVEIPMRGAKESFNVASAAAMALYHVTYN